MRRFPQTLELKRGAAIDGLPGQRKPSGNEAADPAIITQQQR
jgi:hypothetical protein